MIFGRKLFLDVAYCCALIISRLVGLSPSGCLLITSLTFVIYEAASNVMITLNHKFHIPPWMNTYVKNWNQYVTIRNCDLFVYVKFSEGEIYAVIFIQSLLGWGIVWLSVFLFSEL